VTAAPGEPVHEAGLVPGQLSHTRDPVQAAFVIRLRRSTRAGAAVRHRQA